MLLGLVALSSVTCVHACLQGGMEAARELTLRYPGRQARIVAVTADAFEGTRDDCMAAGFDGEPPGRGPRCLPASAECGWGLGLLELGCPGDGFKALEYVGAPSLISNESFAPACLCRLAAQAVSRGGHGEGHFRALTQGFCSPWDMIRST